MNAVTDEIKRIPKNLTIGFGKYQYKAVAEADILAAVKDAEKKYGINSYPANRTMVESRVITKGDEGKESQFVRFETTYRFVNAENPDEYVEVVSYGDGIDSQDKAPGKAMTYADKYALMKAYKIETGDDGINEAANNPELHDPLMVKKYIEELMTVALQKGHTNKTIAALTGNKDVTEKRVGNLLSYMGMAPIIIKALKGL
jgi:hypothetical protein